MTPIEQAKAALEFIQHLHSCEDEGMASGQPTKEDYLKAREITDDALSALSTIEGSAESNLTEEFSHWFDSEELNAMAVAVSELRWNNGTRQSIACSEAIIGILNSRLSHPSPSPSVDEVEQKRKDICKRIIEKWGDEVQINKIQEEALELALVLNQRNCPTKDPKAMEDALYDELADMKIMMMQVDMLFDTERIDKRVQFKFDRVVAKHLTKAITRS